ncbi:phenylalanine--tRNA ligase subunit beta [Inmirania thermothiophila]|uniref:Phenylalanine--tRNA ligase beta subunit n=1 Tax=Inmirania thermothiophila TaxID=1750597 RepID=A0A3N1Y4M3_9GAMM|nr:phenylalanine--tRNA ligase subunit beta [Inmirania thermothiophila]ROR32562.1 phenylalanyl-tRNA synthetase beta subunit [Inmirania thermothiophila]
MRFSERWLREWVDPDLDTAALAERLTMAGLEVGAVEPAAPPFEGVVVGRVRRVAPHPDAERLRVCEVDDGGPEPRQVVCGAPNVREGLHAPFARVGARLPEGVRIRRAKLRGVASEGMLCSARELGLAEQSDGLMELPADLAPGTDLREALALDDRCLEIELTPNRGDCLGIAGIAQEVAALTGAPLRAPAIEPVPAAIEDALPVELLDAEGCPRYVGRIVRGVDPAAETPLWMRERLRRSGIRSLGPLVDVTNYVLLELGQPMHAFDLARLRGGIRVRRAEAGERLRLLDGREVALDPEVLVIADHTGPVALAGIMGGEASGVGPETRDVLLESAFFAPRAILGRARRYGLQTDAGYRFERGVDPELQRTAMERATALLLEICGGRAGPVIEAVAPEHLPARPRVRLRHRRLERVLGAAVPAGEVEAILERLGMEVTPTGEGWEVVPPSRRFDIAIEEDLVEEVARVRGYDRVPEALPAMPAAMLPCPEGRVALARVRAALVDRGYQEAITFSFVDPAVQAVLDPGRAPLRLANPISSEMAVMRTTLWAGLLGALRHNRNRQRERVRLFEVGLRFLPGEEGLVQEPMVAGVAAGDALPEQWGEPRRPVDFYDVKADVEALLSLTGWNQEVMFVPEHHPALHPGQSARIERAGRTVGWMGALHPAAERELDLKGGAILFELSLATLEETGIPRFRPISRHPAIRRDLAVVVDEATPAAAVAGVVREAAGELLVGLTVFDVYRGKGIEPTKKSLALGLTLQAQARTLKDEEVDAVMERVTRLLGERLGAALRD